MAKRTTKVTIYHLKEKKYKRNVYDKCFWEDDQAARITKTGLSSVASLYVSIPLTEAPDLIITKTKDFIVQGEVTFEIDNTTEATQSASLKTLNTNYLVYTINSFSKKDHGSPRMRHWELSGK
ncbi:MAG: DUF6751 family protein [Anaerocolumna sp.]